MSEPTKTCPGCAEVIKAAAKVCPHCQTKQVRFALWRREAVILGMIGIYMGLAALILSRMGLDSRVEGRFVWHGGDLKVDAVRVEPAGRAGNYHVTGVVMNEGRRPWRVHLLEVRFETVDGSLREARQCSVDRPFVVQPGRTGDFRVDFRTDVAGVTGLQSVVRVLAATDGNAAFEDKP